MRYVTCVFMPKMRIALVLTLASLAVIGVGANCTCQREENIQAKERLSKPAPPNKHVLAADDKIDVDKLDDKTIMKRVVHMEGTEIAARLKSFKFESRGELSLARGEAGGLRSAETTRMVQGPPRSGDDEASGDFAVEVKTGDASEMRLAYVNEIFFLKNNNGQWRMSRDPQGERNAYRSEAVGVWRGFYDLVGHALIVEKRGSGTHDGRSVLKYRIALPDEGAAARAAGASLPAPPVGPDGGPAEEPAPEKAKRMKDRMEKWRERAKPAGGDGELWVDEDTGVPLVVKFNGQMVVGDGPEAAVLKVKIDATYSEIGKDHQVPMPKDAIEEVVRKKMPVRPRELLEEEKLVDPLPRDAGPGGGTKSGPPKGGEIPDDVDEG
jgi:hypothetical protein